jgi:hypothetical protein
MINEARHRGFVGERQYYVAFGKIDDVARDRHVESGSDPDECVQPVVPQPDLPPNAPPAGREECNLIRKKRPDGTETDILNAGNKLLIFWLASRCIGIPVLLDPLGKELCRRLGYENGRREQPFAAGRSANRHEFDLFRPILQTVESLALRDRNFELEIEATLALGDRVIAGSQMVSGGGDGRAERLDQLSRM